MWRVLICLFNFFITIIFTYTATSNHDLPSVIQSFYASLPLVHIQSFPHSRYINSVPPPPPSFSLCLLLLLLLLLPFYQSIHIVFSSVSPFLTFYWTKAFWYNSYNLKPFNKNIVKQTNVPTLYNLEPWKGAKMEKRKDPFLFLFFLFFGSTKITTSGSKNQMEGPYFFVWERGLVNRGQVFSLFQLIFNHTSLPSIITSFTFFHLPKIFPL